MTQHYSNPERESDPDALPDVEVFHIGAGYVSDPPESRGTVFACPTCGPILRQEVENGDLAVVDAHDAEHVGWYWQCLPDGEPNGPFDTEALTLSDARGVAESKWEAEQADREKWERRREYLLAEYDAWQNGERATIGQPSNGRNYGISMQFRCREIEAELRSMGAWGNPDYALRESRKSANGRSDPLPPCVLSMRCYCTGHARGNPASEPCDTSEQSKQGGDL